MDVEPDLRNRALLRHEPTVASALDLWWETAKNSMRPRTANAEHGVLVAPEECRAFLISWTRFYLERSFRSSWDMAELHYRLH